MTLLPSTPLSTSKSRPSFVINASIKKSQSCSNTPLKTLSTNTKFGKTPTRNNRKIT
eukprot:Pgem_evm1s16803